MGIWLTRNEEERNKMTKEQAKTEALEMDLTKASWTSRYFSLKKDKEEIYTENIGVKGPMASYAAMVAARIKKAKQSMPKAIWSATIEQQYNYRPTGSRGIARWTRYEIREVYEDGTVGELKISEYH